MTVSAAPLASRLLATPARRALAGAASAVGAWIMPLALGAVWWELAWSTSWIFHFALFPAALFYAAGQAIGAARAGRGSIEAPEASAEQPIGSPSSGSTPGQNALSVILRLVLFAAVGVAGWMVGSIAGLVVGIGLDLVFLANQPSGPGATVVSTVWGTGLVGAVIGMVGSIMWLANRMGRSAQ